MKLEWQYLLTLILPLLIVYQLNIEINPVHMLYGLGGIAFTLFVLILNIILTGEFQIGRMHLGAFLTQTAVANLILGGIPIFQGFSPYASPAPLIALSVGIIAEEAFRIGAFHVIYQPSSIITSPEIAGGFATVISAVVFAAMHLYWYPTQWFFAVAGGLLLSVLLIYFKSQTACVASHLMYDALLFNFVSPILFLFSSFVMLGLGAVLLYLGDIKI